MDIPTPLTAGYSELLEAILELDTNSTNLLLKPYTVGNTGGILHICDADGKEMLHLLLGDPDPVMAEVRGNIASKNALRLLSRPDDVLASQSFDYKRGQTDGAVRMQNGCIISFSTISMGMNEPFCAAIGYHLGMSSMEYLMAAMNITNRTEVFLKINDLVAKALGKMPALPQITHPRIT